MLAEGDTERLLLCGEDCRTRVRRPHRPVVDSLARPPLHDRLWVQIVLLAEFRDRSFRSLYSRSDSVRGLGAAVKYLSHRRSLSALELSKLIPSLSGTEQVVGWVRAANYNCYWRRRKFRARPLGSPLAG